jgi:NAD(P)-dependent dehydrogenase (short-subunit alcohol dehydrogenase family)
MGRLQGKVAFVTGGGSGLGRGMVELFAAEGASVLTLEIRKDWVQETEAALRAKRFPVVALAGDVTRTDDVRAAVRRCLSEWGRLDILVNNAGISGSAPSGLVDLAMADWDKVMAVNLTGPLLCIKEAAPAIKQSGGGSILNVTSISARSCYPGNGAYGISKAALEALTRQASVELAPWGIRVNSMSLGWFRTALNEHVYQRPGELARRNATIPLGRIGTIEDCAKLALFLASDDSSYITGESIESDGGLLTAALKSTFDLARTRAIPEGA